MNREQFRQVVFADPDLAEPIRRAADAGAAKQFGVLTEAAVVALMFPIVTYLLRSVGLPWLHELRRYSELQRRRVHEWIDEKYCDEGLDPVTAEAASEALLSQLEETTSTASRASWERLASLVSDPANDSTS